MLQPVDTWQKPSNNTTSGLKESLDRYINSETFSAELYPSKICRVCKRSLEAAEKSWLFTKVQLLTEELNFD